MEIKLNNKEFSIIKNYINEMLTLYDERDMINENEAIHLINSKLIIYKQDLINLDKKLKIR